MIAKQKIQGHFLAIFTMLVWGTTFISTKVLLSDFNAYEIIVFRLILAYIIFMMISRKILPFTSWKNEVVYAIAALTGVVLYQIFENLALTYTYASTTGVVITTAPMFTAIFTWIILKEENPDWKFFLGFIISMLGIYIVSVKGNKIGFSVKGTFLALAAAALWGVYSILGKKINKSGNILLVTRRVFFYAVVYMIPIWFIFDCHILPDRFMQPINILNILYLGVIASAICFFIWNITVQKIGVISTGLYLYSLPVIAVIASAIILHEKMNGMTAFGTGLTLMGLVLSANRGGRKRG